ncbi:hypothetical protein [Streptomyces sp. JB150]|uniref:hypothetical protein n=1 Tax=Streptomyces sp. JB150 TaxID=2714844 RepID=UPI00140BAE06|nr:hypothetical protein [Streptomyces sp. JB150]QIJ64177.1 hypothetical protein G7Z13_20830 [Streptomyces sp. JB150]
MRTAPAAGLLLLALTYVVCFPAAWQRAEARGGNRPAPSSTTAPVSSAGAV